MRSAPLLPVLAAASWAFVSAACGEPTSAPTADETLTGIASDYVAYEMRSYLTTEGVRSGTIYADSAFMFEDSATALLHGFEMTVYNDQGAEEAFVVADSGRLNQRTEQMTAWGEVVVELPARSCRILSSELDYDPVAGEIRTDKPVRFEQPGLVATGAGFRSDLRMENFSIRSLVGSFNICNSGP